MGAAVRWLVAGYGDVVVRHSVPALRRLGAGVTVWGRDPARAAAVAAGLGVEAAADFHRALDGVDLVYVATPVVTHVALAGAALAAGRHVLIEKPVAGALGGAAGLAARAEAARRIAGVAYYRRLDPLLGALRQRVRGGGPWRVAVDFRDEFAPAADDPKRWRTDLAVSGGGVLADVGSHRLDLLCWYFGAPATVRATLAGRYPGGAERSAQLVLTWPDATTARVRAEWAPGAPLDRLRLESADRVHTVSPLDGGRLATHGEPPRAFLVPDNRRLAMFADFMDAAAHGRAPVCPLADGLLVDRVLVAAAASDAHGGAEIPVPAAETTAPRPR
ncbi:Gfo/Idh/MocA family oxidoreductase [Dactylosporangium aurantiacum]|uniref:Gfo/Idh/MocA family oxidoreductase n=1 Tax=Dactylosporangium aurantiacum TaxID=35754 RepID=A0A9Q9MFS2_9ACTN|nr:Gfo/Idh/MocA family oxidoreductase [Dactylosporangium aurantiacum]MDG6102989.1 Gfo/Idh/MocA family oxidoreductase [Dactylosporangium aurantiacum]UWZ57503.1 Gfo/Idh/MocA family oxidoreductase [Dactylosporangium aurantiacum]